MVMGMVSSLIPLLQNMKYFTFAKMASKPTEGPPTKYTVYKLSTDFKLRNNPF